MLRKMVEQHPSFKSLPKMFQLAYPQLADLFERDPENIFRTTDELAEQHPEFSRDVWDEFLQFEPVKQFISVRTKRFIEQSARKAQRKLAEEAESGNVQAVKQLQELAGLLDAKENNKIIVTHFVPRTQEDLQTYLASETQPKTEASPQVSPDE